MKECKHEWCNAGKAEVTLVGIYLILYCKHCGKYIEAMPLDKQGDKGK